MTSSGTTTSAAIVLVAWLRLPRNRGSDQLDARLDVPDQGNQIAATAPELVPRPLITIEALYSIAFLVGVLLPGWPRDSALLVG